jgi:hypothetical protein
MSKQQAPEILAATDALGPYEKDGKLRITLQELVALGACSGQRDLFRETFGTAAIVDEANAEKAVTAGLNVDWIARSVLTGDYLAEYERSTRLAWAEYERSMRPAWGEYERSTRLAWAEYERSMQQAEAEYERSMQQAEAEYERSTALAFVAAYRRQAMQAAM